MVFKKPLDWEILKNHKIVDTKRHGALGSFKFFDRDFKDSVLTHKLVLVDWYKLKQRLHGTCWNRSKLNQVKLLRTVLTLERLHGIVSKHHRFATEAQMANCEGVSSVYFIIEHANKLRNGMASSLLIWRHLH